MQPGYSKIMAVALTAVLFFSASALSATPAEKETVVAKVNGVTITKSQLDREVKRTGQKFAASGIPMDEKMRDSVLENLINTELLFQEAKRRGIKIPQEKIDDQLKQYREGYVTEEAYSKTLTEMGVTEAIIGEQIHQGMSIQEMIEGDIEKKAEVSQEEIKKFYDDNPAYFATPEQVRASHILITADQTTSEEDRKKARKDIAAIKEKIDNGADFAALAGESSMCPSSKNGGDLGLFTRDKMVPPFSDAAFKLEVGQVSGVVETQFGYHIIKVTEKKPESTVGIEIASAKIELYLKREKVRTGVNALIEELTGKSKIEKIADKM